MAHQATATTDPTTNERLAGYRATRRELERAVLPLATSIDGQRFQFQASLYDLDFRAGGYVLLDGGGTSRLGQVLTVAMQRAEGDMAAGGGRVSIRAATGDGIVLNGDFRPFHDAGVRPAEPAEVRQWIDTTRRRHAVLEIGELLHAPAVPALLDASGFNRHTFLCGQSGSGKTYALGVVLELLLVETDLRVVIIDPNSDYVRLTETRAGADEALAARYAGVARDIAVYRDQTLGGRPIRLSFRQLSPAAQAALLRLDPIADRAEYAALSAILDAHQEGQRPIVSLDELTTSELPGARELGLRAGNLGALDWSIWAGGRAGSFVDDLTRGDARCLVFDIGSLPTGAEQRVVAEAVLSTLWEHRARREPVLIVIDEAHNICPAQPEDPVTALAADAAIRIAAEGRKFGLYLLVSTQRPQKVHDNVLSQCDNLLLMRMNSSADLELLRSVFSFVPAGLLDRAPTFGQGEALVAGRIGSHPAHVRFGSRIAEEGGADVPTSWARGAS